MIGDTRGERNTATGVSELLPTIASEIASLSPDMVLVNGDLVNGDALSGTPDVNKPRIPYDTQFVNWKAAMKPVYDAGIEIYTARGNHENYADDINPPIPSLKKAYFDAFGATVPQNGPNNGADDDQVGYTWDLKLKNVRVVTVDQYFYYHATPSGDRNYYEIDQAWVDAQLSKTAPRPYTIVMAHEPAYSLDHDEGAFYGGSAKGIAGRKAFWDSLGANGVKMYLTSHVHNLQVGTAVDDSGNVIYQNMNGNGGAELGPDDGGQDPLLTQTYANYVDYGFSLYTVRNDDITVNYYLYDPVALTWSVSSYSFTLTANPVYTWKTALGTFSAAANWDPGTAPGAQDTAVFDGGAGTAHTANFTADASNKRLFVASGSVTFGLAGHVYTADRAAVDGSEDAAYCPSLTITGAGSSFNTGALTMDGVTSSFILGAGATATCGSITIEGGTATLEGDITATEHINLAYPGTTDPTLKINSGSNITGDILSGGRGADAGGTAGVVKFEGSADVTGNVGEGGTMSFKRVNVGNGPVAIDGDIRAATIEFAGDNDLSIAHGHTITTDPSSGMTAVTGGDGTLIFDGSATVNSNIGAGAWATRLKEVKVEAPGSTVIFNGTIFANTVTVSNASAAAVIGGTGVSAANSFNLTAGTLDLGANTLTFGAAGAGNYTQAAGTTLKTTVQSASVAGNINASGAAGGTCAVTGASNLIITVDPVYIPSDTTWTILDGAAGTKGVAVLPTITSNSRVLTFAALAANGGDDLEVTATRIANVYADDAAGDPNDAAVGAVLDNIADSGTATGDMATVLGALDALPNGEAVQEALSTLVPTVDSGITTASTNALDSCVDTIMGRMEQTRPAGSTGISTGGEYLKGLDIWGQGFGSYAHEDPRGQSNGYNAAMWGVALGGDVPTAIDNLRIGIAPGYARSSVRSKDSSGRTDIDSYQGTVYAGYQGEAHPYYLDCAFSFGYNDYDGTRHIAAGAIDRIASADYSGQQYSVITGGGYTFTGYNFNLTPLASVQYTRLHIGSYTETGADALDLTVKSQDYDMLRTGFGSKLEYPIKTGYGTLVPELHFKWLYDWIGDKQSTVSSFAGSGSFATNGFSPARSSWDLGGRLALYTKGDLSIKMNYDLEIKEDYWSQTGLIEAAYKL
jgi:outer membrane autotransporter protein